MVEPNCSHDISTPKAFFFFQFRICCRVHSVVTLPITKSRYSFRGRCRLQQTSGTGWRFRTMDSDSAAFSRVITRETAAYKTTFICCFALNGSCGSVFMWMAFFCMTSIQSHPRELWEILATNTTMIFALILWYISFYSSSGQHSHNDPVDTT